ncbi:hypothetical protein T552_00343 [Pneumocystis carinii B80]|uniref:ATP synthase mitochondrial F1 complex assembly factor 1 n=1 Tax=Pneumocystis carinii (strain B80) TaxID=1408658 RepID=A0A0W4ZQH5_PNEC8|nr:hypothetical protein T552_00343 [Pneumocystis carinii B80]KTW30627.1 hypothetical protein T552_00343 [Pneumocystis carinii B80]
MFFKILSLSRKKLPKNIYKFRKFQFKAKDIPQELINKYKGKLEEKMKKENLSSIEELFKKYTIKSNKENTKTISESNFIQKNKNLTQTNTKILKNEKKDQIKTLSFYINVEKIRSYNVKKIESIWKACHSQDDHSLCGLIPSQKFEIMEKNAKRYNMFILPINHEQGIEIHFLQWFFVNNFTKYILITSLLEYKVRGEFARPHTFLYYYTDLSSDKNIVLMKGELEKNRGITMNDLRIIIFQIEIFFSAIEGNQEDQLKLELLEKFNTGKDFNISTLINECNKLN